MILVTGGTGFVGRHLVELLVAEGRAVRVLSRAPQCVTLPRTVTWARGDLAAPASLPDAVRDVDTIVHAGAALGEASISHAALEQVNALGTAALARAARGAGVRRFLHISTAGVYGNGRSAAGHREDSPLAPSSPYERSKLQAENALAEALAESEVRWTVLRPAGLYGADRPATQSFFRQVARRAFWLHGPARVVVHPTHITDLVLAVRRVLELDALDGEIINVAGARAIEFRDLIKLVGATVGHVPMQLSVPALFAPRAGSRINRAVDIGKARRLLHFAPISLEEGVAQTAARLRRQGLL